MLRCIILSSWKCSTLSTMWLPKNIVIQCLTGFIDALGKHKAAIDVIATLGELIQLLGKGLFRIDLLHHTLALVPRAQQDFPDPYVFPAHTAGVIEITEGSGFRYQSQGRRDPFISLALGLNVLPPDERPPGLQGMLIQEVSLHGIVKTVDGYIALIQGTDNKSYFARTGERLYDGNIQEIDDEKVVFRQEINDPLRIEKFQRVAKTLHPVEEQR